MSTKTKRHLESVAEAILKVLDNISTVAKKELSQGPIHPEQVFVDGVDLGALKRLGEIRAEKQTDLKHLVHEPAIARVVAHAEDGDETRTYFICRRSPVQLPAEQMKLASYRSPIGQLASLPVGKGVRLRNGEYLEVLERALLRPAQSEQGWDSRNTILESEIYGPLTVESLRALIGHPSLDEDILQRLLKDEEEEANVVEGIRRTVLTRMELRDQPILDQFQDSIFRLPLNSRLLILGPPGTGKTTTLILRLGQKLDIEVLSINEKEIIQNLSGPNAIPHTESWLMFTPTKLLQEYIKESFSREGIPASNKQVQTWADYRRELAREALGLLRTSTKRNGFVIRESVDYLSDDARHYLTNWFDDFQTWQQSTFVEQLEKAAEQLKSLEQEKLSELGEAFLRSLESNKPANITRLFRDIRSRVEETQQLSSDLRSEINTTIDHALTLQLNRNNNFLHELAAFLNNLEDTFGQQMEDEDIQDEGDEDEEETTTRIGKRSITAARREYRKAVRTQARANAIGRPPGKLQKSREQSNGLGNAGLNAENQSSVSKSVLAQTSLRPFANPIKAYMDGTASRYRDYRRTRQAESQWYQQSPIRQTDIHPLELDMLLLTILKDAKKLLESSEVRQSLNEQFWSALRIIHDHYRNQIFADEATDFSPIQLSCMSALSHPITNSFFVCGDFNQRLTEWGTRSASEVEWVDSKISIQRVTIGYRQSRELNEFARQIAHISETEDAKHDVLLPTHSDRNGALPALAENISNDADVAEWLASRVIEIENFVGQLPSIAILVPKEEQVAPVAHALRKALSDQNINVAACHDGQTMGQENDIRVFDVQHIKGLEFEAVFFKDVDILAEMYPDCSTNSYM